MILNGVCIKWKGYMDMERLDGVGSIEFDEETAKVEDTILREQVEAYNKRMKDFEEHRKQQQRQLAAFMGQHQAAMAAMAAAANSGLPSTLSDRAKSTTTTTSTTSFTEPKSLKIHSSNTSWKMENFQGADDKLEVLDEVIHKYMRQFFLLFYQSTDFSYVYKSIIMMHHSFWISMCKDHFYAMFS